MKASLWELLQIFCGGLMLCAAVCAIGLAAAAVSANWSAEGIWNALRSFTLAVGGVAMLVGAIGLLSHRGADGTPKFPAWKKRFPHISITAAILTVSVQLIICGCLFDGLRGF